jgi:serine phosphatase RsbU (regulator of sigma subunit)
VLRSAASDPAAICDAILRDVREFLGDELPQDDQTLMVVRMERLLPDLSAAEVREMPVDAH